MAALAVVLTITLLYLIYLKVIYRTLIWFLKFGIKVLFIVVLSISVVLLILVATSCKAHFSQSTTLTIESPTTQRCQKTWERVSSLPRWSDISERDWKVLQQCQADLKSASPGTTKTETSRQKYPKDRSENMNRYLVRNSAIPYMKRRYSQEN